MGIAHRSIHVNNPANKGIEKRAKALKLSMKTAGDWLKIKRLEKNLTRSHVAAKMGIATSLVSSWESSNCQPNNLQLEILAAVLDFDAKDFETIVKTPNLP